MWMFYEKYNNNNSTVNLYSTIFQSYGQIPGILQKKRYTDARNKHRIYMRWKICIQAASAFRTTGPVMDQI